MDPFTAEKFSGDKQRLSLGYVMTVMSICASHATRVSKNLKSKARRKILQNRHLENLFALRIPRLQGGTDGDRGGGGVPPRSPLRELPKELLTTISGKAAKLIGRKKPEETAGGTRVREKDEANDGGGSVPPRSPFRERPRELLTTLRDKAATLVERKKAGGGSSAEGEKLEHDASRGCVPPGSPFREWPRELLTTLSGKAKTLVRREKSTGDRDATVSVAEENEEKRGGGGCIPPRSPLRARSKELLTTFSGNAKTLVRRKKSVGDKDRDVTFVVAAEVEENHGGGGGGGCVPPGSPFRARPKELMTTLSGKAKTLVRRKKTANNCDITLVVPMEEEGHGGGSGGCVTPGSPFRARSKELLTTLSCKAKTLVRRENATNDGDITFAIAAGDESHGRGSGGCVTPGSPFRARPKELLTTLSGKARNLVRRKRAASDGDIAVDVRAAEEEEGGVWQKMILMGGRCEPLDFSGVIYYDCDGRQLKDVPARSPRGSPLTNYFNDRYDLSPLKNPYGY